MKVTRKEKRQVDELTARPQSTPRIDWLYELAFQARRNRALIANGCELWRLFPVRRGALRALVSLLRREGFAAWQLLSVLDPSRRSESRTAHGRIASRKQAAAYA